MDKKRLYRIINEEISEFDFLGMDSIKEEENVASIVNSKDFQINLMNDLSKGHYMNPNITDWEIETKYSDIDDIDYDDDRINFEFGANFTYIYQGKKIPLFILIEGNDIVVDKSGEYVSPSRMQPAEYPQIENTQYEDVDISLFTGEGDEINISWIDTNPKLKANVAEGIVGKYPDF